MPEEGLEHPESSTAAEGASASTPEAGPGRGSEDVWQDPLTSGAQQQDAAQGAAEPPDVAAAAARNEAASSTDAPGEEASTELPGADLLAGSGLSGAIWLVTGGWVGCPPQHSIVEVYHVRKGCYAKAAIPGQG